MSLTEKLKDLFHDRSTPQRRAAHDDVVRRLYQAELAKQALQRGDRAPAFRLPSADGALIASADLDRGTGRPPDVARRRRVPPPDTRA